MEDIEFYYEELLVYIEAIRTAVTEYADGTYINYEADDETEEITATQGTADDLALLVGSYLDEIKDALLI